MTVLDTYEPLPTWYLHNPYGIHGIGHAARVLVWVDQIGNAMMKQGQNVDMTVIRWAAALHDVRRVDDGQDLLHGRRAAEWIRGFHKRGPFQYLNEHQLQHLLYCCTWHVPDDSSAPQMTAELVCLKDADGLERVRLNDLDPSYIRTSYAKALCDAAQYLFDETSSSACSVNAWASVRTSAAQMGIWR